MMAELEVVPGEDEPATMFGHGRTIAVTPANVAAVLPADDDFTGDGERFPSCYLVVDGYSFGPPIRVWGTVTEIRHIIEGRAA